MTETNQLVEHYFRHEYANLVSILTRGFGVSRLDMIEDAVGAAMLQAMNVWKKKGVPANPTGWLHKVAKNKILDAFRREKNNQKAIAFAGMLANHAPATEHESLPDNEEITDSVLRMMFVCCHPALDRKSQIAITLKILCGFSVSEIARGLLISDDAAKKRIQRAKTKLAHQNVTIDLPSSDHIQSRLDVVHDVLYLLFNEGYSTSQGIEPIKDDVCEEATRLCHMLCQHPRLSTPNSKALLALMLFHASRLESRTDSLGNAVLLEDQDRSRWDRDLIKVADKWLINSVQEPPSRFHFEAVLAQIHCAAEEFEKTDWLTIIKIYDRLIELTPSPIYQLNRAIAIAQSGRTDSAFKQLEALQNSKALKGYFLLDCAIGHVHQLKGSYAAATDCYLRALKCDVADHVRDLIKRKLSKLAAVQE